MKKSLLCFALLLQGLYASSQELKFNVHGNYSRPIAKHSLISAKTLADLIPGYPATWIDEYLSVELSGTCGGKQIKATGKNDVLNAEQLSLVNKLDLAAELVIHVKYNSKNATNGNITQNKIHVTLSLIPDIEAEYIGGEQALNSFIRENAINRIPEATSKKITKAILRFTVNENGEVSNIQIIRTSGDTSTDALLVESLSKMPNWKPAQNLDGTRVKQEFELNLNDARSGGC